MAVTPGEAANINDAAELKAIEEMEKHIDGCLNRSFRTGMSVALSYNDILAVAGDGWTKRAWLEVQRKFEAVGWTIKKKRNRERYGGSDKYVFSAVPVVTADDIGGCVGPPSWYEADNQGKDQSQIRQK